VITPLRSCMADSFSVEECNPLVHDFDARRGRRFPPVRDESPWSSEGRRRRRRRCAMRSQGRKVTPLPVPGRPSIPRWATPRISVSPSPRDRGDWIPSAWLSDAPPGRPAGPSYRFPLCRPRTAAPIRPPPPLSLFATPSSCTSRKQNRCPEPICFHYKYLRLSGHGDWETDCPMIHNIFNRLSISTQSSRPSGVDSPTDPI